LLVVMGGILPVLNGLKLGGISFLLLGICILSDYALRGS